MFSKEDIINSRWDVKDLTIKEKADSLRTLLNSLSNTPTQLRNDFLKLVDKAEAEENHDLFIAVAYSTATTFLAFL